MASSLIISGSAANVGTPQRLARPKSAAFVEGVGAARTRPGRDKPRPPIAPTRRKSRRDVPSQRWFGGPLIANMVELGIYYYAFSIALACQERAQLLPSTV